MTNELARIFGLADQEKLDAIIETYVSVFGEKYRKRIEYVVKNTNFMVNAATKGVNSVEDFLRDKRYYDSYVRAAQDELEEFSGIKYAGEKMKGKEIDEEAIFEEIFGKALLDFDKDFEDFSTITDWLTEEIDSLIELEQIPEEDMEDVLLSMYPHMKELTVYERAEVLDEVSKAIEICRISGHTLREIKKNPLLAHECVEKVSEKLKLFRQRTQEAEETYAAQREAYIKEYREARGITDEKIEQKSKELNERVKSFAREDQEIAKKIRGMELYSQGQQYVEQKRSEISPELRSKEIEYAEEIMAQVKALYPDMKTCSAEDLVDAFREEYNNASAGFKISKSKVWEVLQIPKSFIERNIAALNKIWNYAGDTLGICFLDEKDAQMEHTTATDPWLHDSLQTFSKLNIYGEAKRESLRTSVVTESIEQTDAVGLACPYLDEATDRPGGLVLLDVGEVNDVVTLHELIHCLGHHKDENGEIYSGLSEYRRAFNEILTEWLTQKCLKKLREQGKCIFNHHDFVCGYRPGFFMFDDLFETYFEELVEAVMTGREKIFKSFTEEEFEELKKYADICLRFCGSGKLNRLVGQMRKLGVELELDKNHNLTKEDAAKIVEHADEIFANITDPSMIEFVEAVVSAHELCTELIEYKASNRQLDYPPQKAAEQRKKIDRIL